MFPANSSIAKAKAKAFARKARKSVCVYGDEIALPCPVRLLMNAKEPKKLDLSKYLKPNNPEIKDVERIMKQYAIMFENMFEQKFSVLAIFCRDCPMRMAYTKQKLWDGTISHQEKK